MYKRARLGLGYLPQEPSAFRRMTALENLLAVLEFQPLSKKERLEKAKALLEELSIYHLRDRMAYSLSGGEAQAGDRPGPRHRPRLPPFGRALHRGGSQERPGDPEGDRRASGKARRGGLHHRPRREETLAITDRVYLMYDGQVLFHGDPETFAKDQGVRRHYLGEDYEL